MEEDQFIKLISLIKKKDCHDAYINLISIRRRIQVVL